MTLAKFISPLRFITKCNEILELNKMMIVQTRIIVKLIKDHAETEKKTLTNGRVKQLTKKSLEMKLMHSNR